MKKMRSSKSISLVLAAAILFAGCTVAKPVETTDRSVITEASVPEATESTSYGTTAETTPSPTPVPEEPIEFNPHVYSAKLAESVDEDCWQAFYNLCDALRKGEDSFECKSEEAYLWATDAATLLKFFPAACAQVEQKDSKGKIPFKNGVAKINYLTSPGDFVKREKEFEDRVVEDLNRYVKSSYSDFEKCVALYDYVTSEYTYNDDWDIPSDSGADYYAFMNRKGICGELGGIYAYMLLQVGVDALTISCFEDICHSWTYVTIDGKSYHTDPTWGLRNEYTGKKMYFTYFMMTDGERAADGAKMDELAISVLPGYWIKDSGKDFSATDDRYCELRFATFSRMDTEKNILYYLRGDDDTEYEFHYED